MSDTSADDLRCPKCSASLTSSEEGLKCTGSPSHQYSVSFNIPFFTEDEEFEEHWTRHSSEIIPPTKLDSAYRFLQPVFAEARKGSRLLDVGCGDGVHAAAIRLQCNPGISYTGIDLSIAALLVAQKREEKAFLVRGNALKLPLKDDRVDIVFSYGVLGYTGAPESGICEMARVLKPGGLLGIWLAPLKKGPSGALLAAVRKFCRFGGKHVTTVVANLIVPFLAILPVTSGVNLGNASWKQCREIVLVNIQPETLVYPTREDVVSWLEAANMKVVQEDEANPITLWARPI